MYLIMKASLPCIDQDDFIPNAVGLLRLAYAPLNTLVQMLRFATGRITIPGAALQACTFTGPQLAGLAVVDRLEMTPNQELDFHARGFGLMHLQQGVLDEVLYPIEAETIELTPGGKLVWHCICKQNTYLVPGLSLEEWQTHLQVLIQAKARKHPLTREAGDPLRHGRYNTGHLRPQRGCARNQGSQPGPFGRRTLPVVVHSKNPVVPPARRQE